MADSKLADLTNAATLAQTDLVYAVVDPAGTPLDRKATVATLATAVSAASRPDVLSVIAATGATETVSVTDSHVMDLTLDANLTLTFGSPSAGAAWSFTLIARQDGTGSRTIAWPASVDWPGGTAPTISTVANRVDVFTFLTVDGGTTWLGFAAGIGVR